MSDSRLQEIQARLDAATAGAWEWHAEEGAILTAAGTVIGDPGAWLRASDADLIAHAPDDLRYLLDRVRELEAAQSSTAINYRK